MSNKAFTEVNEIIAHMPDEYVKKIPANFMKMIIENHLSHESCIQHH